MIREAVVAGKFYPDSPTELKEMLATILDEKTARQDAIGLVSPHAGYIYSGAISGAVISRIKLKDIIAVVREHGETGSYRDPKWEEAVLNLGDDIDSSVATALGDRTLAELLDKAGR